VSSLSTPELDLDPTAEAGLILAQNRCVARTPHLFNPRSASGVPIHSKSRATAHSREKARFPGASHSLRCFALRRVGHEVWNEFP